MDSSCAALSANLVKVSDGVGRSRGTGFWGESTRGSLNTRFLSIPSFKSKTSQTHSSNLRNFKPGVVHAVLTSNVNEESTVKS